MYLLDLQNEPRVAENSIGPRHKFSQRFKSDFEKSTITMKILHKTTIFLHFSFQIMETKSFHINRISDQTNNPIYPSDFSIFPLFFSSFP